MTIEGSELEKIADTVVASIHVDIDAKKLDDLSAERQRLNIIIVGQPDIALESLLAERRR